MTKQKSLDERFDEYFTEREKLDKTYFAASEKLMDKFDDLMKELKDGSDSR